MSTTFYTIIVWVLRLLAAGIMLQTLYFKFSAAPESVYIFTVLGMEPWGRIGIGCLELVASILLLLPKTTGIGALLGTGLMAGALFFHLTKLGLVVQNDGGQLFALALVVFIISIILIIMSRKQLMQYVSFFGQSWSR